MFHSRLRMGVLLLPMILRIGCVFALLGCDSSPIDSPDSEPTPEHQDRLEITHEVILPSVATVEISSPGPAEEDVDQLHIHFITADSLYVLYRVATAPEDGSQEELLTGHLHRGFYSAAGYPFRFSIGTRPLRSSERYRLDLMDARGYHARTTRLDTLASVFFRLK